MRPAGAAAEFARNASFGALGYRIAALFAVSWGASVVIYRFKGYD
jgi:hypothetical protein